MSRASLFLTLEKAGAFGYIRFFEGMKANYGYRDGMGEFYITIDTERCDGCGECVPACPAGVLGVGEDPDDPLRDEPVAFVVQEHRRRIHDSCGPCKPSTGRGELPCMKACPRNAITHGW
jgi:ferredoxin